ncbi:MAG: TonB-dependent receptor [Gammaproteobacteria bacterium]
MSGPLVALPGGELKVAAGVTHRSEESSNEHTDPMYGRNTHAERRVTAEFAELSVPLVGEGNALPWMQGLLLSAAVRRDDYSDFGSTTNPKVGIRWSLTPELDFRINWSKAFRPPTRG